LCREYQFRAFNTLKAYAEAGREPRRCFPPGKLQQMTGYAFFKYGFLLVITIVILWFISRYILPLIT
jgi:hypothetical protein